MNRRISIGLALIGSFGSLGILTSLFDPFSAVKTFLIVCGAFGLLGYAAIHLVKSRTELFNGKKNIFLIAGLTFFALFFIRAITSMDRNLAFYGVVGRNSGLATYSAYVITFILAVAYIRTSVFEALITGILISGVIAGFYSLLEQFGLEPWKMSQVYEGTSSLFGNPNFSGAFLSLAFVAAMWSLIYSSKKSSKRYVLPLLTLVLSGFGVYTSQALQGYISIVLGSIVILLYWAFTKGKTLGIATLSVFSVSGLLAVLELSKLAP